MKDGSPDDGLGVVEATPSDRAATDAKSDRLGELLAAVRTAAPEAFLVPPRILRRVLRHELGSARFAEPAAARESCPIDARRAEEWLDPDELGLPPGTPWPPSLLLLAQPDDDELRTTPLPDLLQHFWRLIYRARVHQAFRQRLVAGRLPRTALLQRIDRIGQSQFDEVRAVLRSENLVLDRRDRAASYIEFATLYAELRSFAPGWLPHFFPSLGRPEHVDAILADDVNLPALLAASRPAGAAPLPLDSPAADDDDVEEGPPADADDAQDDEPRLPGGRARHLHHWLISWAERAAARGNAVRAASCRLRAARLASPQIQPLECVEAVRDLEGLAQRLAAPLELDPDTALAWNRALPGLLPRAARGVWSPEARLLYDLQKIAVEHGREVYAVDLVAWFLSAGRTPVKRPLPDYSLVLCVKHLRSARRRLARCHLDETARDRLAHLLQESTEKAEDRLRHRFGPRISATLDRMGWQVRNVPERVARQKLVQELLDRIIESGHLTMGDLRDAVSRSDLKLPDLTGPGELWRGDRLLRTDEAFRDALDGVYRPGEVYVRWLQRASSLGFGTATGRTITRYALLPFGGAFVALEGLSHLVNPVVERLGGRHLPIFNPVSFVFLGLFLLGLINQASFRARVAQGAGRACSLLGWLLTAPLRALLGLPLVRAFLRSRTFDLFYRWAVKPLMFGLAALTGLLLSYSPPDALMGAGLVYLATAVLLNTRRGRDVEEIFVDRADRAWQRLRFNLVPGLFRWITESFGRVLEGVERVLYALDEWRRFHAEQRRPTIAAKALLGVLVFFVAYVVRFGIVLVIEPQVNPIKHFPVVTVSHKVLAPLILALPKFLTTRFGVGKWTANIAAGLLQFILPGIFGFLVWELKENWKLFEANRRRGLEPVIVGHHGETVARLVRPGFHSGTLPKLFSRLRRADRKPAKPGRRSPVRKVRDKLRGVEKDVRHLIEREFLPLLGLSQTLRGRHFHVAAISLGTNRIALDVAEQGTTADPLRIAFEEQSGWLVAGVVGLGWVDSLDAPARAAVRDALAGLYKRCGVDLVRQQIEALLPESRVPYDVDDDGLVLWPGEGYRAEVLYPFARGPDLPPRVTVPPAPPGLPTLDAHCLLLSRCRLTWARWIEIWERDDQGQGHPEAAIPGVALLPDPDASRRPVQGRAS